MLATKRSPFKLVFACGINYWMFSWKPTWANVGNNQNLLWMRMKSWTCFKQGKFKNLDSIICIIASNHLPLIVNNTSSSMIAMEPRKKPNFWTIDFEWQALQGPNFLRCNKILSQCHHFLSFLPIPFLPCKKTFMNDYDEI